MRSELRALGTAVRPLAATTRRLTGTRGLTIIGWHRVDDASSGLSTGFDAFRRHLDALEDWGAAVLPLEQAVAALGRGTLPERAVVLTFDDGYASILERAWPELRDRGLPATLFAVTGYLTGRQRFVWDRAEPEHDRHRLARGADLVAAARAGLGIGSHTVTHSWLPALDPERLRHELVASRAALEDLLGSPVTSLAYPSGGWSPAVRAAVRAAGYEVALTVDRGLNTRRTPRLSLRRTFVPDDSRDLRLLLDGAYTFLRPLDSWRRRRVAS